MKYQFILHAISAWDCSIYRGHTTTKILKNSELSLFDHSNPPGALNTYFPILIPILFIIMTRASALKITYVALMKNGQNMEIFL